MQIKIADTYRALIVSNIRKSFADVMGNLKERYPNLTNDDLLYCVLSLLRCPKDVILHITNVSADAIKVRKNRIKGKIDAEPVSYTHLGVVHPVLGKTIGELLQNQC